MCTHFKENSRGISFIYRVLSSYYTCESLSIIRFSFFLHATCVFRLLNKGKCVLPRVALGLNKETVFFFQHQCVDVITPLSYLVPKVKFFLELNTRSLAGISINYPIFLSFFFVRLVKLKVILSNIICTIKGSKLNESEYIFAILKVEYFS